MSKEQLQAASEEMAAANPPPINEATFKTNIATLLVKGESKMAQYQAAQTLLQQHSFITNPYTQTIHIYRNGIYAPTGDSHIKAWLQKTIQELRNRNFDGEVTAHIYNTTLQIDQPPQPPPNLICVKNGLLNLETLQLEPHTPHHYFFNQIPINYDPTANCPKFKKFLTEIVNPPYEQTLQEIAGYCLWRSYPAAKGFMLYGEGNNGKSTYVKIIEKMLGEENIAHIPLHKLNRDRFSTAQLHNRLANTFTEISDAEINDLSVFKAATGGDTLYGEFKFKNQFPFTNHAKQIFSANKIPRIETNNDNLATWRRWLLIPFEQDFTGRENKNLLSELCEEMEGIFVWALEGLRRLQSNNWQFSGDEGAEKTRNIYLEQSDSIGSFCNTCLTISPDGSVKKKQLYLWYADFCRKNKKPIETENSFFRRLPEFFSITEFQHKDENNHRERYIGGVEYAQDTQDTQYSTPTKEVFEKLLGVEKKHVYSVYPVTKTRDTRDFPNLSSFDLLPEPHGLAEGLPSECCMCGLKRCYYVHKVTYKLYCPNCARDVEEGKEVAK